MTDAQSPKGEMRVSNADRDQVVQLLEEAQSEGRLTSDEVESRSVAARSAVTYQDLAAVTADLPQGTVVEPDTATTGLMRIDRRFGNVVREGPWVVPRRIEVKLIAANVRLDFTESVINVDNVQLDVDLGLGSELTLVVQPGIKVVAESLDTRQGDYKDRAPSRGDTPVFLRVEVGGRLRAGADLVIRSPKQNFDQRTRPDRAS
jgi:uncharacterized protein DUF1707